MKLPPHVRLITKFSEHIIVYSVFASGGGLPRWHVDTLGQRGNAIDGIYATAHSDSSRETLGEPSNPLFLSTSTCLMQ
jgi:hypothetical protein